MGKTLYLDCSCGISGDMTVAALLDLGANENRLRDALSTLPVSGYEIRIGRRNLAGIDCCDFDVALDAEHENHDHDMAYLHGMPEGAATECAGGHEHERVHDHHDHRDHEHTCDRHGHGHGCGGHVHHEHRGPADLDRIIDGAQLAPRARELAHRMVAILASAEAKAHAVPVDEVHFHEVGAIDSIIDIASVAVLLDDLDVDRVIVPRLVDGHGTIRCQHGIIPVPVPATLNIVSAHGLPLEISDVEGELVTPTGAAIVAAANAEHNLPCRFIVKRVGLGAGKRTYTRPSILRALWIEEIASDGGADRHQGASPTIDRARPGDIVRIECDIDDATGEVLAYAAERLRAARAREVHWVPVFSKKGRPAWQLQVIAAPEDVDRLEAIIFAETTTIGIRRWSCERTVLERREETVATPWGPVRRKIVTLPDGTERSAPEYEDARAIAQRENLPLQRVMDAARG